MIQLISCLKRDYDRELVMLNSSYHQEERLIAYRIFRVLSIPEHNIKIFEFKTRDTKGGEHITRINGYPGQMGVEHVKGRGSDEPEWMPVEENVMLYFCTPSCGHAESENAAIYLIAHARDMHSEQIKFAFEIAVYAHPGTGWATTRKLAHNELQAAVDAWSE